MFQLMMFLVEFSHATITGTTWDVSLMILLDRSRLKPVLFKERKKKEKRALILAHDPDLCGFNPPAVRQLCKVSGNLFVA